MELRIGTRGPPPPPPPQALLCWFPALLSPLLLQPAATRDRDGHNTGRPSAVAWRLPQDLSRPCTSIRAWTSRTTVAFTSTTGRAQGATAAPRPRTWAPRFCPCRSSWTRATGLAAAGRTGCGRSGCIRPILSPSCWALALRWTDPCAGPITAPGTSCPRTPVSTAKLYAIIRDQRKNLVFKNFLHPQNLTLLHKSRNGQKLIGLCFFLSFLSLVHSLRNNSTSPNRLLYPASLSSHSCVHN